MRRQSRIRQEQVETLISSVLGGYYRLLDLDGSRTNQTFQGGLLRNAVSDVTVRNAFDLDRIIEGLAGLTVKLSVEGVNYGSTSLFGTDVSPKYLNQVIESDRLNIEAKYEDFQRRFESTRDAVFEKMEQFKNAMLGLQEAYRTGSASRVVDALEEVASVASWGTRVPVPGLYDAGVALKDVARFNYNAGFKKEAGQIINGLNRGLVEAQVREYIMGFIPSPYKVKPLQTYTGPIALDLVAEDLVRMRNR